MNILNRKLTLIIAFFIAGVFLYQYSPFLTLLLLPLSLISLIFLKKRGIVLVLATIMFFTGGMYVKNTDKINRSRTEPLTKEEMLISGTIISIPEAENYGQSAICLTEYGKIRLMTAEPILKYKDNVTFRSKCYYPAEKSRPFAFDYPGYLKSDGIYLLAFAEELEVTSNSASFLNPADAITLLRSTLIKKADTLWTGEALMFARAILLGDTSYSSEEFRDKLSTGSISHIIAVSGTHVSLVAAMFFLLSRLFSKRKRWLSLLSIPFIFGFVILTGVSPSSVRAAIMMALFLVAKSTLSHYDGITALAVAAFAITLSNPFAAFSLSFILSFSAVFGILIFAKPISEALSFIPGGFIKDAFAVTLSAQVFTALTLCFSFGRFPFTALIANFIALPLVPFIMATGYISLIISFFAPAFTLVSLLTEVLMSLCLAVADLAGRLPLSNIYPVFQNSILFISIFILFIILLFTVFIFKAKKTSIVILLFLIVAIVFNANYTHLCGEETVYFTDAAHGDGTFVFNKDHAVMIECLSPENNYIESGAKTILRQHGFSGLDALFLSEIDPFDEDVSELFTTFPVKTLYFPETEETESLISLAENSGTEVKILSEGDSFTFGEIKVSVLLIRNGRCSFLVTNSDTDILIPGNITVAKERDLSKLVSECDIIKAPRHGNKDSSTAELLGQTTPKAVIVSTGRALSDDFSERLSSHNVYSTKLNGDITVKCGDDFNIIPYKKVKK